MIAKWMIAVSLALVSVVFAEPPTPPKIPADLAPLLAPFTGDAGVPAIAAAIVRTEGVIALGVSGRRAVGHDQPASIDDRFHLGSCTKAMTATLAAIHVERGNLEWESTIAELLPGLKDSIRAEYAGVTLRQLLQHRSGLPGDSAMERNVWAMMWALSSVTRPVREGRIAACEQILKQAAASKPGEVTAYTNLGYVVAAAMLESAAEASWEDLIRRDLFAPLEMQSAGFGTPGVTDEKKPSQPWGHRRTGEALVAMTPGPRSDNPTVTGPAGNVHASIADWASFIRLHLRGARAEQGLLISPDSFAQLRVHPEDDDYALGWLVSSRPWAAAPGQAKGLILTHAGSNTMWYCTVWIAPEIDAAFLVACNAPKDLGSKICDTVIRELLKHPAVKSGGKPHP